MNQAASRRVDSHLCSTLRICWVIALIIPNLSTCTHNDIKWKGKNISIFHSVSASPIQDLTIQLEIVWHLQIKGKNEMGRLRNESVCSRSNLRCPSGFQRYGEKGWAVQFILSLRPPRRCRRWVNLVVREPRMMTLRMPYVLQSCLGGRVRRRLRNVIMSLQLTR